MNATSQRRGSWAGYVSIEHGDFDELCDLLLTKDDGVNVGWNIHSSYIDKLSKGNTEALRRFKRALKVKMVTGKGYFFFVDKVNDLNPVAYKNHGLKVKASNLCSEIALHSNNNNTFTCVLSSMNLAKYDEWKDTDAVYWATIFLDCVAQEFIQLSHSIPKLDKVVASTEKGRAIGLGQMGLHTMLQLKRVPFESLEAHMLSNYITKKMQDESFRASEDLSKVYGEPEWCLGTGKRNTHTMAIAPTKSTSLIMGGVSEGINPDPSMMYVQTTAAGEVIRINPVLLGIMKERSIDIDQASLEIQWAKGSVQGLSWLSDKEKEVFKTAFEMDMDNIVRMASARQRYVDQAQSLNLFFSTETPEEKVASVHKKAFLDKYIKSLYYIYSMPGIEPAKDNCIACT